MSEIEARAVPRGSGSRLRDSMADNRSSSGRLLGLVLSPAASSLSPLLAAPVKVVVAIKPTPSMSQSSCHLLYFYFSFCTHSPSFSSSSPASLGPIHCIKAGKRTSAHHAQPYRPYHTFLSLYHSILLLYARPWQLSSQRKLQLGLRQILILSTPMTHFGKILAGKKTNESSLCLRVTSGSCVHLLPLFVLWKIQQDTATSLTGKIRKIICYVFLITWLFYKSFILSYNPTLQFWLGLPVQMNSSTLSLYVVNSLSLLSLQCFKTAAFIKMALKWTHTRVCVLTNLLKTQRPARHLPPSRQTVRTQLSK